MTSKKAVSAIAGCAMALAVALPGSANAEISGSATISVSGSTIIAAFASISTPAADEVRCSLTREGPGGGDFGPDIRVKRGRSEVLQWPGQADGTYTYTAYCVNGPELVRLARQTVTVSSGGQAPKPNPEQAPPPKPLQGPAVSWDPVPIGGLTAHIQDRSGKDAQCTYKSDWYTRSFFLRANTTFDLVIFPAVPKFQNWNITITCDNGTKTETTTFF